jgi:hypothetical protein
MDVSGQLHVPAALLPGEKSPVTIGWRLGGSQSQSGRDGKEKTSCPCRESSVGHPVCSLVTVLTELPRYLRLGVLMWVGPTSALDLFVVGDGEEVFRHTCRESNLCLWDPSYHGQTLHKPELLLYK